MMSSPTALSRRFERIHKHLQSGNLQAAGQHCELAVQQYPEHPEGWLLFSELWLRVGHTGHAVQCAKRAMKLAADESSRHAVQATRCLVIHGSLNEARQLALKTTDHEDLSAPDLVNLGNALGLAGDHEAALGCFQRAVALEPDNPNALYNLATSLRLHGETESAESVFDQIIELKPSDFEAWYSRSLLRKQTTANNHIDALKEALESAQNDTVAAHLHYALAKELEDLGLYDQAFDQYRKGADLRDRQLAFDPASEIVGMQAMQSDRSGLDPSSNVQLEPEADDPIFIVGLPRSGTTLLEQILSAHSAVVAAGELNDFPQALYAQSGINPRHRDALSQLAALTDEIDFGEVGRRYLDSTRQRFGSNCRVIDKLPSNFLYLGPLSQALPGARIILLERHPMDSCLAIFRALFRNGYPWSYNLEKIGDYYSAYHALTRHWLDILPPEQLIRLSYEELVDDPHATVAKLLDALHLDWQDDVMNFHQAQRAVATPSSAQVREPIYSSSVGRWKRHADALEPLIRQLQIAGVMDS